MRKRLWQLHSWLGLVAGLGLIVIGLTGSLLVFHEEIEGVLNPSLVRVGPEPGGRQPLDLLLAGVNRELPGHEVVGWLPRPEGSARADQLYVIAHGTDAWLVATLDPYSGRLLASPRSSSTTFTGWMIELHYSFFADHAGVFAAGLIALLLCVLGVTGVWLYRDFWKNLLTLRWGRSRRILFSDLHKFVGITSVAFNLILGFTGAYWNLTHVIGEWIQREHEAPKPAGRLYADTLSLDRLVAEASRRLPGYRGNYLSLPTAPGDAVTFYGEVPTRNPFRSPYGSLVSFDAQTGELKTATDIRDAGVWAQAADMFGPLHYGTFGGLPVKVLWTLGGLTPGVLAVTGFVLWWSRRPQRRPALRGRTAHR